LFVVVLASYQPLCLLLDMLTVILCTSIDALPSREEPHDPYVMLTPEDPLYKEHKPKLKPWQQAKQQQAQEEQQQQQEQQQQRKTWRRLWL
jgi:hypothetical protein